MMTSEFKTTIPVTLYIAVQLAQAIGAFLRLHPRFKSMLLTIMLNVSDNECWTVPKEFREEYEDDYERHSDTFYSSVPHCQIVHFARSMTQELCPMEALCLPPCAKMFETMNDNQEIDMLCDEVLSEIEVGCYAESTGFIKHVNDFPAVEGSRSKYEVVNVPSKNNNCLFACLRHALGEKFPSGVVLKHWYSKLRQTLRIFPNELIPITKCEELSILLNMDIYVYDAEETLLLQYNRDEPIATARIMVIHNHAYWIRERNVKLCDFCGNCFNTKGFAAHKRRCSVKDQFIFWKCCECGKQFSFPKTAECSSVEQVTPAILKAHHTCNQRRMSFFQRVVKKKDDKERNVIVRPLIIPQDCDLISPDNPPEHVDRHMLHEYEIPAGDPRADDMFHSAKEDRFDVKTPVFWRYICEEHVYAFDIEAFPDPHKMSIFQPYSVGTYFSAREGDNKYKAFFGLDCMEQLAYDMLYWKKTVGIRTILAFNGRGFDFLFLLEALSRLPNQRFSNIVANGTQIMSFRWGKTRSFDLFSFFTCSLSKLCAEFRIDESLQKATFPHDFIRSENDVSYVGPIPDECFWPEKDRDKIPRFENRVAYFGSEDIANAIWPTEGEFNLHAFGAFYLEKDVMGMYQVYCKFAREVYERLRMNVCLYISAPALAYDMFRTTILGYYIPQPADEEMQGFFQRAVYGGRVYPRRLGYMSTGYDIYKTLEQEVKEGPVSWTNCFDEYERRVSAQCEDGETRAAMVQDYLADLDVVSLYPTAMMKLFPCGKMAACTRAELDIYQSLALENPEQLCHAWNPATYEHVFLNSETNEPIPFKTLSLDIGYGVFCVDIVPRMDLLEPVLPRRCEKTNVIVWDLHPIVEGVYTSIDLFRALRRGYVITKFHSGVMFNDIAPIMLEHINRAKGYKEEGDADPVNKGAIRSFGKLILNSTYGKFLQRPRFDKCSLIPTEHVFDFLMNHAWKDIIPIDVPNMYFVNVTVTDTDERAKRISKPTYLGAFVLSHSRLIMDNIYQAADPCMNCVSNLPYYGDTDSLILPACTIPRIRSSGLLCENGEKRFGCVSNENGADARIIRAFFLAPKSYCFEYINSKGIVKIHSRMKGVPADKMTFEHFVTLDEQRRNMLAEGLQRGDPELVKLSFRSFQRSGIRPKIRYLRPQNIVSFAEKDETEQENDVLRVLQYLDSFHETISHETLSVPTNSNDVVLPARKRARFEPLKIVLSEITRSISASIYVKREWNVLENYSLPLYFDREAFVRMTCEQ